ncbi:MAG: 6-pyruvoyl-tetrahydropterin synthase-related protein [Cyanobacteriota bacterium]|nr:6-pyruvoyl-tetrahydropterin synthase-related protein [Cyanobacteriota bacterium]
MPTPLLELFQRLFPKLLSRQGWLHLQTIGQSHYGLLMVAIAVAVGLNPMVNQGYPETHSLEYNLIWTFQYDQQFLAGQFYPRWLEQSWGSLGSPSFYFYGPICMVATLPFALLGWDPTWRMVGAMGLAMVVMGLGAYLYSRQLFQGSPPWLHGLVASLAVLSPYFLENIYIRGAMGEVWAMACLPWVLATMHRSLSGYQSWGSPFLAIAYALFALCHPPTLLLFTLLWLLIPFITTRRWSQWKIWLWRVYFPMILGLGLASFYLLPAVIDQEHISLHHMGFANPLGRILVKGLGQLQPQLTRETYDVNLLPIYWLTIAVMLLAGWTLWKHPQRFSHSLHIQTQVLLIGSIVGLIMMTDLGSGIFRLFPLLQKIQFSWRWMAITGVMFPFLWGIFLQIKLDSLQSEKYTIFRKIFWRNSLLLITALLLIFSFSTNLQKIPFSPRRMADLDYYFQAKPIFPQEADLEAEPFQPLGRALFINADQQLIIEDVWEYLPAWIPSTQLIRKNHELIESDPSPVQISGLLWQFGHRQFVVEARRESLLTLRMYAWPCWAVNVNGQPTDLLRAPDGRLQVRIPSGRSAIQVTLKGTVAERWGWIDSGLSLIVWLVFVLQFRSRSPRFRRDSGIPKVATSCREGDP